MGTSFTVQEQIRLILNQSHASPMYRRVATGEELVGEDISNSKEGRRWSGRSTGSKRTSEIYWPYQ